MTYIERLKKAIKDLHGCGSKHLESVPIEEYFQGRVIWSGLVEVFELSDHPKATRCYAWSAKEGTKENYTAVLGLPPVTSPRKAVQVAIASQQRTGK